jgi:hypothetical protein
VDAVWSMLWAIMLKICFCFQHFVHSLVHKFSKFSSEKMHFYIWFCSIFWRYPIFILYLSRQCKNESIYFTNKWYNFFESLKYCVKEQTVEAIFILGMVFLTVFLNAILNRIFRPHPRKLILLHLIIIGSILAGIALTPSRDSMNTFMLYSIFILITMISSLIFLMVDLCKNISVSQYTFIFWIKRFFCVWLTLWTLLTLLYEASKKFFWNF